jgi:hypothetical protein
MRIRLHNELPLELDGRELLAFMIYEILIFLGSE